MTRFNALRSVSRDFVAWGKEIRNIQINSWGNIHALVFAAVLIICSVTVGCSSDKPKPVGSKNQIPAAQAPSSALAMPAAVMPAESKPAPKKPVQHKKPATVNYMDKNYGVTFEYSRRYAIETGNAAADLLTSSPVPMNFVAPGGVALAAVELPETGFANTDFSSAFFNVSVNKNLTADQCNQFAVPQPKVVIAKSEPVSAAPAVAKEAAPAEIRPNAAATEQAATASAEVKPVAQPASSQTETPAPAAASSEPKTESKPEPVAQAQPELPGSKLILGDMELRATEAVSGEGTRQSDAKYFHVYQNGACYEFALNVTTVASQDGLIKHVDRDKVFSRLEKILDTVKINPVAAAEEVQEAPATTAAAETPAQ